MIFLLVFWLFLLGALFAGWQAGDHRDRQVILAIAGATLLTTAANMLAEGIAALVLVGIVDLALLAVVARYALTSQRFWPVWFAGFHTAALVFGGAAMVFAAEYRLALQLVAGFWALPALGVMVIGLLMDKRRGILNSSG